MVYGRKRYPLRRRSSRLPLAARLRSRRSIYASVAPRGKYGVVGGCKQSRVRATTEFPAYAPLRVPQRAEFKAVTNVISSGFNNTPFINHVNEINQGTALIERIGVRAKMLAVLIKFAVKVQTSTVIAFGKLALVYDRQPQGVLPIANQIYDAGTVTGPQVTNNRDRFEILWEKTFSLTGNTSGGLANLTGKSSMMIDERISFSRDTNWAQGTSGAIANTRTGALYLVSMGDSPPGFALEYDGYHQTQYVDA